MSEWDGNVPLLGFEGENSDNPTWAPSNRMLNIPTKHYGTIVVFAWSKSTMSGEGYNIFFPNNIAPFTQDTAQARNPFDVKMIVQAYLNRLNHYIATGEDHGYEVLTSSA